MSIACIVEREIPKLDITEDKVLGIDVGIRNYISTSDGRKIDNPHYLYHLLGKVRYLSRSLSRKKRLSKNWVKIRHKLQRLYIRISVFSTSYQQCLPRAKAYGRYALKI